MCVFLCHALVSLRSLLCYRREGITGIERMKNCSDREAEVLINLMLVVVALCF